MQHRRLDVPRCNYGLWAAAEAPQAVGGLVLIGPFVRNPPTSTFKTLLFRLAVAKPWGPAIWHSYYAKLYPGRRPADLDAHREAIRSSLRRPGAWRAFTATTRTTHAPVEARLGEVTAPALTIMGSADPDFADPAGEARLVAHALGGDVVLVPDAGHYPHAEYPELVAPAVVGFLERTAGHA